MHGLLWWGTWDKRVWFDNLFLSVTGSAHLFVSLPSSGAIILQIQPRRNKAHESDLIIVTLGIFRVCSYHTFLLSSKCRFNGCNGAQLWKEYNDDFHKPTFVCMSARFPYSVEALSTHLRRVQDHRQCILQFWSSKRALSRGSRIRGRYLRWLF